MSEPVNSVGYPVLTQVKDILSESNTLESVAPRILKILGQSFRWEWGVYWKLDPKTGVLRPAAIWNDPMTQVADLENETRKKTLASGEDMPGAAWRNQKAIWSVDISLHMALPRSLKATNVGLRGGAWFPIKTALATYGVIELLGTQAVPIREEVLDAFEAIGNELGRFVERTEVIKNLRTDV